MSCKSLPSSPTPLQLWRPDIDDYDVEKELLNHNSTTSRSKRKSHIVNLSPSNLPHGWLVEERPRVSNPSHVDRYYYEPVTGRQFRSLLSVQRYLAQETGNHLITERMMSKNDDTTCVESGTGQRFLSVTAVDNFCSGENACTATPKLAVKSGTGKQRARNVRHSQKPVHKPSSVEEDKITLKALKQPIQSTKFDSLKKTNSEEDNGASMHNLTAPPAKVSWVLSGPGGFWNPFVDDSIVTESEKLKWSEAFVLSIHGGGVINELAS